MIYITPTSNQPTTTCLFLFSSSRSRSFLHNKTQKKYAKTLYYTQENSKNILLGPITAAGVTEAFQGFHQFLGFHEFMVALLSLGSPGNKVESSPPTGKLRNKKSCSYMKTGYWQNRGHSKHIFFRSCLMPTPLHEHARCPALSQLEAARWKRTWDGDDDDLVESPQGRRCTQGQYLPHPPSCTSACKAIGHS